MTDPVPLDRKVKTDEPLAADADADPGSDVSVVGVGAGAFVAADSGAIAPPVPLDPYDADAILIDPNAHPLHKMYAEINIGVRDRGEVWEKCANCGDPYMHTEEWSASTVCSERCFAEFAASLDSW